MSSTQVIQASMANLQLGSRLFTYEEIYEGLSDTDPYARIEGGCGGNISRAMDFLDAMVNQNISPINMSSISIQASRWLTTLQEDFTKAINQGDYQRILANKAKEILHKLCGLEFADFRQISNLFREVNKWVVINDERHKVTINVINNKSLQELTLTRENNILAEIPWAQLGDSALKISMAAVFPNASTITDAGSSVIQTITILSNESANDIRHKIQAIKILKFDRDGSRSTNCIGSLIYNDTGIRLPILNMLDKNTRSNLGYEELFRRRLMTEVGINLYSNSTKGHIELAIKGKSYDYRGPLYKSIHWTSNIENMIFEGESDTFENIPMVSNNNDQEYEYDMKKSSSAYWADNHKYIWHDLHNSSRVTDYVNAILDGIVIPKDNTWVIPKADPEKLHNRLLSMGRLKAFECDDYKQLYGYHSIARLSRSSFSEKLSKDLDTDVKELHRDLKWKNVSGFDYQHNMYILLKSTKYSESKDPRLVQNIIATYNNVRDKSKSNNNRMFDKFTWPPDFGRISYINHTSIQGTVWIASSEAYRQLHIGFDEANITIKVYTHIKDKRVLNWDLFFQRNEEHKYSSIEEFWYGSDIELIPLSSMGSKSLLSSDLPVFHEANNAKIITEIIVYKSPDNWISNSIKRFNLPDLIDNAIIKYEMFDKLIFHGRLGDIISANRWITIIPFE